MLKVVIADDEERICQLINALIDWEELQMEVVGIAHNGLEAAEMVKEKQPDILITDIRMPGCNGLELIEDVKESRENLEIIIISGYAHFSYAQTAIKFGVRDYLLKPINKGELFSTLKSLKQRIEENMANEEMTMRLMSKNDSDVKRLRSNLLERLVERRVDKLTENILLEEYSLHVEAGIYQAFWISADADTKNASPTDYEIVLEKVQSILESELRSCCTEMLFGTKKTACIGFINYLDGKQDKIRHVFKECLNRLESSRTIYGNISFSAALGSGVTDAVELQESFFEASLNIKERLIKGSGRLFERFATPSSLSEKGMPEKYLRLITQAIEVMNIEEADEVVNLLSGEIKAVKEVRGYEIYELVLSAANLFLSQVDSSGRVEQLAEFETFCASCGKVDELFEGLKSLQRMYLEEIIKQRDTDTVRPIRMAKQYIQNHYNEPITQEEVSNAVGLSAAYFSVLFKKVEGEGFAKYLINVRMEQAKILLRESNIPVSKVCQQVGYNDLKHFTHTFEKATGVKPATYRKLYG